MSWIPSLFRLPSRLQPRARRSRMLVLALFATVLVLFVTPLYVVYKPPGRLISYLQQRFPTVLWEVSTSAKVVALTIDDSPSPHTDEILRTLDDTSAHATFFLIGSQIPGHEQTLERLVQAGNELGNHAMYDGPSKDLGDSQLAEQIASVHELLQNTYSAAGKEPPPKYFRPGSGFFSERMLKVLDRIGYKLVLGGVYPHDPQIHIPKVNAAHILSMVRPGAVIVCHDRRGWTAPMLRLVLPKLKERGYRVVTVTELIKAAKEYPATAETEQEVEIAVG